MSTMIDLSSALENVAEPEDTPEIVQDGDVAKSVEWMKSTFPIEERMKALCDDYGVKVFFDIFLSSLTSVYTFILATNWTRIANSDFIANNTAFGEYIEAGAIFIPYLAIAIGVAIMNEFVHGNVPFIADVKMPRELLLHAYELPICQLPLPESQGILRRLGLFFIERYMLTQKEQ